MKTTVILNLRFGNSILGCHYMADCLRLLRGKDYKPTMSRLNKRRPCREAGQMFRQDNNAQADTNPRM